MPLATIVLLLKNAEAYLADVLDAVYRQEADFEFEVLAIDSGSRDRTLEILARYPARLVQIPAQSFNHGETRNLGARQAHPDSRYIVYLTQDAQPYDGDWLRSLVKPLQEDPQVAGVFSRHIPRPGASVSTVRQLVVLTQTGGEQRLVKRMPASLQEYEANRFYYITYSDTSSALRRSVWEQIPYDPVNFAEDTLWADKVLRRGYTLIFEPASRVLHSHNYSLFEQFKQNVDHSHAMDQLYRPPWYHNYRTWFNLFIGIPLQVIQDCRFVNTNTIFRNSSLWYKVCNVARSPFWHLASVMGSFAGVHLEKIPYSFRTHLSRQEQIKKC